MAEDTASVRGAASPGTRSTTCTSTAPPNGRPPDTHLDDPGGRAPLTVTWPLRPRDTRPLPRADGRPPPTLGVRLRFLPL